MSEQFFVFVFYPFFFFLIAKQRTRKTLSALKTKTHIKKSIQKNGNANKQQRKRLALLVAAPS